MQTNTIGISAILPPRQLVGGVASYISNLLRGMAKVKRADAGVNKLDLSVFYTPPWHFFQDTGFNSIPISGRWGRFIQETWLAWRHSNRFEVLYFLNYFTPPCVRSCSTVTVIHDLQYYHMPENFSRHKQAWLKWCHINTLRSCDKVITISEAVRQDVLHCYGDQWSDRVQAIWNPVDLERFKVEHERDFTNGRPYIMSVAVDRPQKNLATLIRAFHRVRKRFPDFMLVLVGQLRSLAPTEKRGNANVHMSAPAAVDLVNELDLKDHVCVTGFISDPELGSLYRQADLFVLPSLFEGFGMPAIESLALGVPTLVSRIPALTEVTLGKAQYLENPEDDTEMASAIESILSNVEAARPDVKIVKTLQDKFAPATIARRYLSVLAN